VDNIALVGDGWRRFFTGKKQGVGKAVWMIAIRLDVLRWE
jgi:hypothetical protein